jgi:carboxymethylenebutenolidase
MRLLLRVLPVLALSTLAAGLAFPQPQAQPRKYALLVGVNAYDNAKFPALRFAVNDATKLAALLEKNGYTVQLLTDQTERKPTRVNIEAVLAEFFGKYNRASKRTEPGKFATGDTVLIGLAGHGVQYGTSAYFCPRDAILGLDQTGSLVALNDVYEALENAPRGVKFLLVDACRNDDTRGVRGGDSAALIQPPSGVGVLLSCSAKEVAYEHESLGGGHGVFFYHVLKGLEGAARDPEEPVVTWDSLRMYVRKRVPRTVAELYGDAGHQQHPNEMGNLSGTPPVLVKLQGDGGDGKVHEVEAGEVKIPAAGGEIPAYRAMPASGGPFPVILVVQEIFGVHEHIKDLCRRLAKAGYLAVAPELYARQGDVSKITDIQEIISKVVSKVPDEQVMKDLDATAAWARQSGKGDTARLGITGFSWGGRIVWLYAAHNPNLKAGVAWYGRLVSTTTDPLHPKNPIDVVGELKAPVLGLYGGADMGIPNDTVVKMQKALKEANKPSESILYADTPHGFNADYRATYRKDKAEDGWKRMLEWFKKNGVG